MLLFLPLCGIVRAAGVAQTHSMRISFSSMASLALACLISPVVGQTATREGIARTVLSQFGNFTPEEKQTALQGLVGRVETANVVLEAMEKGTLPRSEVSGFCARQMAALGNDALTARLTKTWGRVAAKADAGAAATEIAAMRALLTPKALATAKLPHGRLLFQSSCGTCHQLFGQGKALGPDLTGSNRRDLEYLLENIVTPNALVGSDYELQIVTLKDGRVLAGLPRQETANTLTLQSLTGAEDVRKDSIAKREQPGISLMPEGQLAALRDEEKIALIAYLQSPTQVPMGASLVDKTIPENTEGEALKVISVDGEAKPQGMGGFPAGKWSRNQHLWWTGGKPGAKLRLAVPVPGPGRYKAAIALTTAPDYGMIRISAGGKVLVDQVDGYSPVVTDTGALDLGNLEANGDTVELELEIIGKNPAAARSYMVGLDYVSLMK